MAAAVGSLRVNLSTNVGQFVGDLGKASGSVRKLDKSFGRVGRRMSGLGKQIGVGIGLPMVMVGVAAVKSSEQIDEALRSIAVGTGATGDALDGLGESFNQVFGSVPESADAVASAIATLNTITGATGPILEDLTKRLFDASRVLGEDGAVNAKSFATALAQFNVPAEQGAALLDQFFVVSQRTGAALGKLTADTNTYGSVLRNAGFSMAESAAVFGQFQSIGIEVSRVMPGLNAAFRRWAADGQDVQGMLAVTVAQMQDAATETEALTIATAAFGAEGAQRMTAAVRQGAFSLEGFQDALEDSSGAVTAATTKNQTLAEVFGTLKNRAQLAFKPLGDDLKKAIVGLIPVVETLADRITAIVRWFTELSPAAKRMIAIAAGLVAALGPVLFVLGQISMAIPAIVVAAKVLGAAFALLASPVGIVVAALVGLGVLAYKFRDQILDAFGTVVNKVKEWANTLAGFLGFDDLFEITEDVAAATDTAADAMADAEGVAVDLQATLDDLASSAGTVSDEVTDTAGAFGNFEAAGIATTKRLAAGFKAYGIEATAAGEGVGTALSHLSTNYRQAGFDMLRLRNGADLLTKTFERNKVAAEKAVSGFSNFKSSLKQALSGLKQGITGSEGGIKGLFTNLGTGVIEGFGNIISGGLSSLINMGVGLAMKGIAKLGGWVKGLFGGAGKAEKAARKLNQAFEDSVIAGLNAAQQAEAGGRRWAQGVIGVRAAYVSQGKSAKQAERDVQRLWDATKQGPAAYRAVLAEIQPVLDAHKALGDSGVGDHDRMREAAQKYGIKLEHLGSEFNVARLRDAADLIAADFELLKASGADVSGVLVGMQDEVQGLIDDAARSGVAVPSSMRPIIDSLIEQGSLTDANGDKLQSLDDVNFAEPIAKKFDTVIEKISELIDSLRGKGGAEESIKNLVAKMDTIEEEKSIRIKFNVDDLRMPDFGNRYADIGDMGIEHFARGGIVRRPTIGLVGEAGPEAIIPLSQMGGGGFSTGGVESKLDRIERLLVRQPDQLARATRDAVLLATV